MTEDHQHPADAPEQEITSDAAELIDEPARSAPEAPATGGTAVTSTEAAEDNVESEQAPSARPSVKLERLQKILAQAGIASRRRAEELITQGRVQVNGKIVTELGTKADAGRDHIRVDGKLLHGADRLRYFMLNKPKGFVTTVKDPEGRATVMQFFEKLPERLYPVGRLDYQSEGLLLVTNDGELANLLTKASSGVEKTYLVKVSGQPTESELDILRGGVSIPRGKSGDDRVRTAPARIRQVRQGDNPWYEVVLIEGRNRELRKMFEEVGHFVEKIRRVGYGPLVLDIEPGQLRELEAEELVALRRAAAGKLRTPKAKELRRRNLLDAQLPTLPPRPSRPPRTANSPEGRTPAVSRPEFLPKPAFGKERPFRSTRPPGKDFRPADRGPSRGPASLGSSRGPVEGTGPAKFGSGRPSERPFSRTSDRSRPRPAWKKDDRAAGPTGRPAARPDWKKEADPSRPSGAHSSGKQAWNKSATGSRPPLNRPASASRGDRPKFDRPKFDRPIPPRRQALPQADDFVPKKPRLQIDAVEPDRASTRPTPSRPFSDRPKFDRAKSSRTSIDRPKFDRPKFDRPQFDRTRSGHPRPDHPSPDRPRPDRSRPDRSRPERSQNERPSEDRSGSGRSGSGRFGAGRSSAGRSSTARSSTARPSSARPSFGRSGPSLPQRGEGLSRPFTTSTGKPRPGGARPSSKAGGRTGWKPKPSFGSPGKPATSGSKPKPGGFSKSSYKGKPGGATRSGSGPGGKRPGGKRPGGPPKGKRRG
jgi:23S rRNA pseudouridine2605 synthase